MSASEHNKYAAVIAAVATAAALLMVLLFFQFQNLVVNAGDPYDYGKIARGFVEHGFTKMTRRAASLYPEFIAVVYRLGGSDYVVILLQCLFHAATCVLVFRLGLRIYNARTGLLAGLFCAFHPMLLRYVPDLHMESLPYADVHVDGLDDRALLRPADRRKWHPGRRCRHVHDTNQGRHAALSGCIRHHNVACSR